MIAKEPAAAGMPLYRVDKFAVPVEARAEFLERVASTHALLRRQEGFVQDFILEQESGPGVFNFVTLVEWDSADAVDRVAAAVRAMHAETGFDRQAFFATSGVTADIANYRRVEL